MCIFKKKAKGPVIPQPPTNMTSDEIWVVEWYVRYGFETAKVANVSKSFLIEAEAKEFEDKLNAACSILGISAGIHRFQQKEKVTVL